jgi:signal transduction histidine kinase
LRTGAREPEGPFPSEIMPLVSDLNAYAADNQAMIERSRVQAGNLAHGLRTPLAVIIDEAERLSANPTTRSGTDPAEPERDYGATDRISSCPRQIGCNGQKLDQGQRPA